MAPAATTSDVHTIGTLVWVADPLDSWKKGEVSKVEDGAVHVVVEGGALVKCKADSAFIQNPEMRGGVEVRSGWARTQEIARDWQGFSADRAKARGRLCRSQDRRLKPSECKDWASTCSGSFSTPFSSMQLLGGSPCMPVAPPSPTCMHARRT